VDGLSENVFQQCFQWRNYGVAWVAKCQGQRAGGETLGPPASELKTLKIYLSTNYNYIKIFISYFFFI
jgi:hypothetical protein